MLKAKKSLQLVRNRRLVWSSALLLPLAMHIASMSRLVYCFLCTFLEASVTSLQKEIRTKEGHAFVFFETFWRTKGHAL